MARGRVVRVECEGVSVFLLIVLAALHHTVKAQERKLDMAPDAVDDNFSHCRDKMLKAVTEPGGLLQEERKADKEFEEFWSHYSGIRCNKSITGGTFFHADALQVYGNSKPIFRKRFNDLVYSKGSNGMTYRAEFPFKSLHFLLTDSFKLLSSSKSCKTVYYGTEKKYTADPGTEVRFGKFLQAKLKLSPEQEKVEEDGGSLFHITSCSVLNVEEITCQAEELQCLISPAEVFTVQGVRNVTIEGTTFKNITLKHSRFLSNHSCSFFPRSDSHPPGSSAPLLSFRILPAVMSYVLLSLLLTSLL